MSKLLVAIYRVCLKYIWQELYFIKCKSLNVISEEENYLEYEVLNSFGKNENQHYSLSLLT